MRLTPFCRVVDSRIGRWRGPELLTGNSSVVGSTKGCRTNRELTEFHFRSVRLLVIGKRKGATDIRDMDRDATLSRLTTGKAGINARKHGFNRLDIVLKFEIREISCSSLKRKGVRAKNYRSRLIGLWDRRIGPNPRSCWRLDRPDERKLQGPHPLRKGRLWF